MLIKIIQFSILIALLFVNSSVNAQNALLTGQRLLPGQSLVSNNGKYRLTMAPSGRLVLVKKHLGENRILWVNEYWNIDTYETKSFIKWIQASLKPGSPAFVLGNPMASMPYVAPYPANVVSSLNVLKSQNRFYEFMFYVDYFSRTANTAVISIPRYRREKLSDIYDQIMKAWLHRQNPARNPALVPDSRIGNVVFPKEQTQPFYFPGSYLELTDRHLTVTSSSALTTAKPLDLWGVLTHYSKNSKLVLNDNGNLELFVDMIQHPNANLYVPANYFLSMKADPASTFAGAQYVTTKVWESNTSEADVLAQDTKDVLRSDISFSNISNYTSATNEFVAFKGRVKIANTKVTQPARTFVLWSAKYVELLPGFESAVTGTGAVKFDVFVNPIPLPVSAARSSGNPTSLDETVNEIQNPAGFLQNKPSEIATVFPNPTHEFIDIQLLLENDNIQEVSIYDLEGKLLLSQANSKRVNVAKIPSGQYIVRIRTSFSTFSQKIIKN
jgi:Secretion system C-terminal sorting domain